MDGKRISKINKQTVETDEKKHSKTLNVCISSWSVMVMGKLITCYSFWVHSCDQKNGGSVFVGCEFLVKVFCSLVPKIELHNWSTAKVYLKQGKF